MSSIGVCNSPSYKPAETSECAKRVPSRQKVLARRHESKAPEHLNYETEKKNNEPFDDSSTRVFVFKEVSSLDEDESCNLGRRGSWSSKLGLVKKIKLSEDGTALISESFEKFCENHKSLRLHENRPQSSDTRKVAKPLIQPAVERGIKKPQRPTTASKLSDIAVNKYPDSIFKVYIPEGNRIIKKKRVVPIVDLKPATPVRTGPVSKCLVDQGQTFSDKNTTQRTPVHPKTKHSLPQQSLQNTDKRLQKAAGEQTEEKPGKQPVQCQSPKKMTHITDISLTKEQENKRIKEREAMRKRTMDVVKMAFPVTGCDESKTNDLGYRSNDSDVSGDERSRNKANPSKSKSSLKSHPSVTSCGHAVTAKRSVTWGENEWSDSPSQPDRENRPQTWRKKKNTYSHRNSSSNISGRTDLRSGSKSKLHSGSKSNMKSLKGIAANRREKNKNMKPRIDPQKFEKQRDNKNDTYTSKAATEMDSSSESGQKDESDREARCSREKFLTKKHVKNKRSYKRCDCGRFIGKHINESENEKKSRIHKNSKCMKHTKNISTGNKKYSSIDREDSFQTKRNAIIRKHSTKDTLSHSKFNEFNKDSNVEEDSDSDVKKNFGNVEETFPVKRGRSTPSLRKILTVESTYGSSDSEICFRKDHHKQDSDRSLTKTYSCEGIEEKPLQKIFDSSNLQNEVDKSKLSNEKSKVEKIASSKSLSGTKLSTNVLGLEQNIETFTEGFKTLNMKSMNFEDMHRMEKEQWKYSTEDDSTKENLMKEDCIHNLQTVVQLHSEEINNKVKNLSITSNHCNSPMFTERLSKEYVLVDAYSMVTNSSKSLSREQSCSVPLIREVPMLNLPYDDKSGKGAVAEANKNKELPKKSPKSATEISSIRNVESAQSVPTSENSSNIQNKISSTSNSLQDHLQNDYSQPFKVTSKIHDSEKTKKPSLKSQKSMGNVPDSINTGVIPSQSKIVSSEKLKSVLNQQPKQILTKKSSENNYKISEKNMSPLAQKQAEERKNRLQKMLSRGESVGASKMANQIMEKWNSTQKSISQRKEKMLATIRDARHVSTVKITNGEPKNNPKRSFIHNDNKNTQITDQQMVYKAVQETDDRLPIENTTLPDTSTPHQSQHQVRIIEQYGSAAEEEETTFSEKEDFQTTIILPGSRLPQPYSATNILDISDRHLDESLSPYTSLDTPEKPLCELNDSGIVEMPFQNNIDLVVGNDQRCVPNIISDVDETIPERDLPVSSPTDPSRTDKVSPGVNVNARSSISDVDSTYGSTRSNASNNESSNCSHIQSLSVEAVHSDENYTINQTAIQSPPPMRKVEVMSKKWNALPKSASYSRTTSHDRSISRKSKASSSGSSRRSVEPIGRPPSRKPQIIDTTDEDSDQEIITNSSTFHVECYRNAKEPLKKAPTSRMYSTLNHTPHPGQESIKTAIKDLDDVQDDARSWSSDRPTSNGPCSSRGGYQSCSSRPSSGKPNMPKMSPGSVKILREKSRNDSQRNVTPINISTRSQALGNKNTRINQRGQTPKKQGPGPSTPDQRSTTGSPLRKNAVDKPPFRYCYRNKSEDEDMSSLRKLKNFTINKTIENYLPPWERVDLTPPESALRERASNERRLGIKSRVTARTSSPQSVDTQSNPRRSSGTETPKGSTSPVLSSCYRASVGLRSPVSGRTPFIDKSTVDSKVPFCSKPLARPRTPGPLGGGRSPVENITAFGSRIPANSGPPKSGKAANDCRTPVNCRSPVGNLTPVAGSRSPVRNRTPHRPERNPSQHRTEVEKKFYPRSDDRQQQQTRKRPRNFN